MSFNLSKFATWLLPLAISLPSPLTAAPGDKVYQEGFLSVDESLNSIELPNGYSLDLLLTEPTVEAPVMAAWDGNGAMYVVQMRSYMLDVDGKGEKDPISMITRHEDTNGDGTYDKTSIFADNLMLPRFVMPLDDRVIVGMTNTLDLWTYRDSTGDGVADEVVKIYEGGPRGGNMEHQPSGLLWSLDNWMYLTYEAKRYRFTDGKFISEDIPRGSGQWGLTQDNWGRLYFSDAGGEKPAIDFQQPIVYGGMNLNGQLEEDFSTVHPIAEVPDAQGGPRRIGANGGVNHFTGAAGQSIFRGDRLPEEMRGSLFIPEPVGRLIRQAKVDRNNAKSVLKNVTPGSEFIRTRDVNFRPVWTATTPSGQMLIVDMHHGIVQQANWTKKGTYLRGVIQKWGLDKNTGKGRVYRLVHEDFKAGSQPRMLDETTQQLVAHLSHPNGWWRDTAQKLIVLREDRDSVVPMLEKMAQDDASELGRLHALWTLEGIGKLSSNLVAAALKDPASIVRTSAIRLSEPFIKSGDTQIIASLSAQLPDDREMIIQLLNSISASQTTNPDLLAVIKSIEETYASDQVVRSVMDVREEATRQAKLAEANKLQGEQFSKSMEHGKVIYQQLCFSCHGEDGHGAPLAGTDDKLAPSFVGSPRVVGSGENAVRVLLNGLEGPIEGKTYVGLMVSMATNDDQWISDVVTYIKNSFGNEGPLVTPEVVAKLREQHADRSKPWTIEELTEFQPAEIPYNSSWKLTASNNDKELNLAFDGKEETRYSSEKRMAPGMWIQIEFPEAKKINGITLDTTRSQKDFPRGYQVQVSDDGKDWGIPVASGAGTSITQIHFPTKSTRFVRVTQTGKNKLYWSIHEMTLFGHE